MNWVTPILQKDINETEDTVLDLGCGNLLVTDGIKCKTHVGVDFGKAYLDSIKLKIPVIYGNLASSDFREIFVEQSFDVVVMIDFIEHIKKSKALSILKKAELIARKRVIVFTPEGFVPQTDGLPGSWAAGRPDLQSHKSGWEIAELEALGYKVTVHPDTACKHLYAVKEVINGQTSKEIN